MRVLRGNDILINWSVFYDAGGVKTNVDFSNSTLSVFILDSYGKIPVEHTVSGNVISIHYGGEIQRLGTIAIDAYWQNNNTLVWSRAKKNEVVELVDNPESVTLDGSLRDISITTINTSSDTFFGGTYNANFSNYYTKEQIDNKIITDYNFLSNKPLIYDEETGKYTAVDAPINFVNNINIGNFVASKSGINFTANGSGEIGTLIVRDRLILNGVEITGSGTGGLDVENMWNVLGSADDSDKQINVVHLTDALSGYLQTSIFDDLFEKVNIGTLETPKYAIKAKYDFYSIGEVSAFGAGSSSGSSGGGLIETVYGINGLSATYSDANLAETFNAATIKKIYDDVVNLQNTPLTYSFSDITGLPTTLSGYGITDGVTTTAFNALVNDLNTYVNSNAQLTDTQKNVLAHLQVVNGKLQVDIDFYSTGEVSAFGAGSGTGGSGLIQTVYGLSDLGGTYTDSTSTDTFNAYAINSLHNRINSLEAGSTLSFTTIGSGNAVTLVTKSGNIVTATKGLTFSVDGHTHSYLALSGGTLSGNLTAPTFTGALIGNANSATKVNHALTFTGYSTGTFDGSDVLSILIPNNTNQLVNGAGYLKANQNITISGDASGSGTTSIALTLTNSGVVAGTYNNSSTQVRPFTVDAKGRVTGIGTAVTIQPAWGSITGKPTTISGYGITDAYTKTQTDGFLALKLDKATFNDLFEKINIGTTASPVYAIKAKYNFYSVGEVSAFGAGATSYADFYLNNLYAYGYVAGNRFYTGYDSGAVNSISCSNWFRSNGTSGWVNETYGGGITMTDITYVRVYNNKAFWVDNNIVTTGEVTTFGASDIRLKSNIKQIDSALDFLSKVKTYEFDWNEKAIELNPLKTKRGAGVIAQELNLLDNNFVHSIYGDYLGVDYERFIPYLIGGVNEVADEVTILKKRVAELELEIKQLKK